MTTSETPSLDWYKEVPNLEGNAIGSPEWEAVQPVKDPQCWTATITRIDPIPGKDRIVLATIDGYQSIIGKDQYQVGDIVCYISEQSVLPETLIVEIGLYGKLAGANKDRVKAIRMGGVVSQGIICKPDQWKLLENWGDQQTAILDDVLGVSKFEPSIPVHLTGKWIRPRGDAPIVPMYDIENIKKQRHFDVGDDNWYDPFDFKQVCVTEKLHGTNVAFHMNATEPGKVWVYSKGVGQRGFGLEEDPNNTYWKAFRGYPGVQRYMESAIRHEDAVTVYGEVYGKGIQDLDYGQSTQHLAVFDVRLWNRQEGEMHLNANDIQWITDLPVVPILYVGVYDYERVLALSVGQSTVDSRTVREGVVCVDVVDALFMNGHRRAAKFINPDYLLRGGEATEFN